MKTSKSVISVRGKCTRNKGEAGSLEDGIDGEVEDTAGKWPSDTTIRHHLPTIAAAQHHSNDHNDKCISTSHRWS